MGLTPVVRVRYKGTLAFFEIDKAVYFQYVPQHSKQLTALHNLGTSTRDAENNGGFRLSTSVEKPVDNSVPALEADRTNLTTSESRYFSKLDCWMACG